LKLLISRFNRVSPIFKEYFVYIGIIIASNPFHYHQESPVKFHKEIKKLTLLLYVDTFY